MEPLRRIRVSSGTVQTVHDLDAGGTVAVPFGVVQTVMQQQGGGGLVKVAGGVVQTVYSTKAPPTHRGRAWGFVADGHATYVLDLGPKGALVFDATTRQWSRWESKGYAGHWDFKNGFQWISGRMVVGGSAVGGGVRRIDPDTHLDEGWRPVDYEVRGALFTGGTDRLRQYALRLIGATGQPADEQAPVLKMRFSDDQGVTWSPEHTMRLKTDTRQRIEFRSLGAFAAPGRIFRLYDEGGIKYLAYVEAEIGGEDGSRAPA